VITFSTTEKRRNNSEMLILATVKKWLYLFSVMMFLVVSSTAGTSDFLDVKEINAAKASSNILLNSSRQLQAKFKHAADFGVLGNYSKANGAKFSSAINQHINSAGVQAINGTYRGQSVIHYLNPHTGLNVMSSPSGQFISGWKLNSAQLQNVLQHGGLGGL
jgi:hypothetical protein